MHRAAALAVTLAGLSACQNPPEISYETAHFEIATDFDAPVCEGTLDYFESHLEWVEGELGVKLPTDTKIRVYWLEDTLDEWCREGASGCFYPGTKVLFSNGRSISHEMVHVLLNAEAHTSLFIEEGLAELYSGVGTRYRRDEDEAPPVAELVWLTPDEYRGRKLDYALAGHFAGWLRQELGPVVNQRLAGVVTAGGGPEDLARELDRLHHDLDSIEANYTEHYRTSYRGLRDTELPELELDYGVELELNCGDPSTMGPLPDGSGGMYQVHRLVVQADQLLDLHLYAGPEVRLDLIDTRSERGSGQMIDFHMPIPRESLEHPHLQGTQQATLEVRKATYLLYVWTPSHAAQSVTIEANLRPRPALGSGLPRDDGED